MKHLAPLALLSALAACSAPEAPEAEPAAVEVVDADACLPLEAADKAALRQLDQDYGAAWLLEGSEAQSEALMKLFAEDAVIIPGAGAEPLEGRDALEDFWFHEDSPPTIVNHFERATASIEGTSCLAAITGRSSAQWEYEGETTDYDGNYMILAAQAADGSWQIGRMIWNSRPGDDE
ncbi:YybH family protein [Sphingomicrobium sediminis]|uniref:Nuclear transport factor 2 family protein n=1 Tax=Sphingomicrobium sediminis TaxID=2950949 RepID=A0A9X2EG64_9SPHN|nr:nuclear transport factor 2 family protein [Sphingomicrobium sediminis]MCM8557415.1 nuclear transport factor 2 family protein [Sphingomicrobium sediminis]